MQNAYLITDITIMVLKLAKTFKTYILNTSQGQVCQELPSGLPSQPM